MVVRRDEFLVHINGAGSEAMEGVIGGIESYALGGGSVG